MAAVLAVPLVGVEVALDELAVASTLGADRAERIDGSERRIIVHGVSGISNTSLTFPHLEQPQ